MNINDRVIGPHRWGQQCGNQLAQVHIYIYVWSYRVSLFGCIRDSFGKVPTLFANVVLPLHS